MHIALIPLIGVLLIVAIAWYAINQLTLPPMVKTVIIVLACVILIIWVASVFGLMPGGSITIGELSHYRAMLTT
jgi:hypothetical protein